MGDIAEVRWHGRGGQGAVTAAKVLAEVALKSGKNVQAFPEYGPERTGAPLRAYNRISERPIRIHCQVESPNIVVVIDPSLLDAVDVTEGASEGAIFIINTPKGPSEVREVLKLRNNQAVYTVDATKIALDTIGRPIPNTPMLGALSKATGLIPVEGLLEDVKRSLGKKLKDEVVEGNLEAIRRAYREVKGE